MTLAITWERARELSSEMVLERIPWRHPSDTEPVGGVDCSGAVRSLLERAGADFGDGGLWDCPSWEDGEWDSGERVAEVERSALWEVVATGPVLLPRQVEPLDVVLTNDPAAPLHVSAVLEPMGARLLTAVVDIGVTVVRRATLGQIVGVYRYCGPTK